MIYPSSPRFHKLSDCYTNIRMYPAPNGLVDYGRTLHSIEGDASYLATLLYLAKDRGDDLNISISFPKINSTHADASLTDFMHNFFGFTPIALPDPGKDLRLGVVQLLGMSLETFDGAKQIIADKLAELMRALPGGYTTASRLSGIEHFLKQQTNGKLNPIIYSWNGGQYCILVYAKGLRETENKGHLRHCQLQSVMPSLLPALVKDHPITNEERILLSALAQNNIDYYRRVIDKMVDDNLSKVYFNQALQFEQRLADRKLESVKRDRADAQDHITDLEMELDRVYRHLETLIATERGLMLGETDRKPVLIPFLESSKDVVSLRYADDRCLSIEIRTPLANFNPDMYEDYNRNQRCFLYDQRSYGQVPKKYGKKLMDSIFITGDVNVYVRGSFTLMPTNTDRPYLIERDFTDFTADCLDNPHFTEFRCPGNNDMHVRRYMREQDLIGAITQLIAATGNLNLAEINNTTNFMGYLFGRLTDRMATARCLEVNGQRMTVMEYIDKLQKEENNEPQA